MSGFTTFLSKLGKALATGLAIAAGVGPIVIPFLGSGKAASIASTAVNDFTAIGQTVVSAEALIQGAGTGAAKLAAATPLVTQIIQTSELVAGKKIANEALFVQGSSKITSGMADVLNSLEANAVQTSGTPLVVPAAISA